MKKAQKIEKQKKSYSFFGKALDYHFGKFYPEQTRTPALCLKKYRIDFYRFQTEKGPFRRSFFIA